MLVMSSITFSIVHLYLLTEMSTYLVIIQFTIEQVHFLFSIYSLPKKIHLCVNCVNIYKLLLRGSVFRVNIYCILRQEPLQKTLCESILFIFSPYCTRCSLVRIKCLVLSCLVVISHYCLLQIFIDRFRYNANRASQVQSKLKQLEKL